MTGIRQFALTLTFSAAAANVLSHLGQYAFRHVIMYEVSRTLYEGAGYIRGRVVPKLAYSGGRGFDASSIQCLPGPMPEGEIDQEVDFASSDPCRGALTTTNLSMSSTSANLGTGPAFARKGSWSRCQLGKFQEIKSFHPDDVGIQFSTALAPFVVSTALVPFVVSTALVPFTFSTALVPFTFSTALVPFAPTGGEFSKPAVDATPKGCWEAAAGIHSGDGTYTVFYCSAQLSGLSPLCVAGSASRERAKTASEAVSHAALDPRYSTTLCFPTAVHAHDLPAVVSSMALTVFAERPRQPWTGRALLAESVSSEDLLMNLVDSTQLTGVNTADDDPSQEPTWFERDFVALSEAVEPWVLAAGRGLIAWGLISWMSVNWETCKSVWALRFAFVCWSVTWSLTLDGVLTANTWLRVLSLAKLLAAKAWLAVICLGIISLGTVVLAKLVVTKTWLAVLFLPKLTWTFWLALAGSIVLVFSVFVLAAAASLWIVVTDELGLEEQQQSQSLPPTAPTREDDAKNVVKNPACAQPTAKAVPGLIREAADAVLTKAEKKARRKAMLKERRARGTGVHISAVRC